MYYACWIAGVLIGGAVAAATSYRRGSLSLTSVGAGVVAALGLWLGARLQFRLEAMPTALALDVRSLDLLDSGTRLPLGVAIGAAGVGLWCVVFRLAWRDVGDALALGMVTTSTFGRLGCILNGCCPGALCPSWLRFLCETPGPGTVAWNLENSAGLIPLTAREGLPVLPLAWFFSLSSLGLLLYLLWRLRRDAPHGEILLTACIVGPLLKLALEQLRYDPRPGTIQLGLPAALLVVSLAWCGFELRRRRRGGAASVGMASRCSDPLRTNAS